MNCHEFQEILSDYIDDELEPIVKKDFELHLLECRACKKEYETMVEMLRLVKEEEEAPLPEDYHKELRSRLESVRPQKIKRVNWKILAATAASFVILISSIGLGRYFTQNNQMYELAEDAELKEMERGMNKADVNLGAAPESYGNTVEYSLTTEATEEGSKAKDVVQPERKRINNGYLMLDIINYDETIEKLTTYIEEKGGYIENAQASYNSYRKGENEINLKRGHVSLRIPENHFSETIDYLKDLGKTRSENISVNDITKAYYDTKNNIKNLEVQEKRLRELLAKADNVSDMLQIENELRRIRTEIERNSATINTWDHQVAMSAIRLELNEVERLENKISTVDKNIWGKAKEGFIKTINGMIDGVESLFVFIITIAPLLLVGGIGLFLLVIFIRWLYRKRQA